ncbi:hypothetical protein JCM8547_007661 [Rhodosporidiobolus lusitaniae]
MPLWLRPALPWPETLADALKADYGVDADFVRRFAGSLPEDKQREWIKAYACFMWNGYVVSQWWNRKVYEALAVFLLLGLIRRLCTPHLISRLPRPFRRLHTLAVKHFSLAPLVGRSNLSAISPLSWKNRFAPWTTVQVPLRLESLFLVLFLLGNFCVIFTDYRPLVPSAFYPDDPTPFRQNARYLADRAGITALGTTPLVILLAARNSPLSWITQVNFGTMQLYHRWVARVTFANVGIHAAAYSWLLVSGPRGEKGWKVLWDRPFMVWAWVAFVAGLILCFAAWRRIRQVAYEAFLAFHIIAAIGWIVGAYFHVLFLKGGDEYHLRLCYLAAAAWAFDRVFRLFSLLWNNTILGRIATFPSSPSKNRFLAAQGALIGASDDFLRLRITPRTSWSRSRGGPGAYVFISSWTTFAHKGWESHPFSIAWPLGVPDPDELDFDDCVCEEPASPPMVFTPGTEPPTKLLSLDSAVAATEFASALPSSLDPSRPRRDPHPFDAAPATESFELLIKRYSGFTRALASSLPLPLSSLPSSQSDDPLVLTQQQLYDLHIAVEGPYGAATEHAVAEYRQALLVAGGSGLAMVTSQLADLAGETLRRCCKAGREVEAERVAVVWSIRETETIQLLTPYLTRLYTLFRSCPSFAQKHLVPPPHSSRHPSSTQPFLDLHIYVTGSSTSASLTSVSAAIEELDIPPAFLRSTVHSGRPEIGARIDALASSSLGDAELLVASCGPASLCDSAREAVRSRLEGFPALFRHTRGQDEGKEEEDTGEEDEGEGLLGGRAEERKEKSRWEACRLVYSEEAVVW